MNKIKFSAGLPLLLLFLGANLNLHGQTWSFTGSMETDRAFFSATTLTNGQVLVLGGRQRGLWGIATAELYNPSTGTFTATGNLVNPRADHAATLLQNGKVLIAGGDFDVFSKNSGGTYFCLSSAELYDPSTGTFTLTGSMHVQRCRRLWNGFTATLLQNGKVLIVGVAPPRQNRTIPRPKTLASPEPEYSARREHRHPAEKRRGLDCRWLLLPVERRAV
jgi:hypothetical protein